MTVTGAEAVYQHFANRGLVDLAFRESAAQHFDNLHAGGSQQIVDVPAQGFGGRVVATHARFEISFGTSGVAVAPCRKIECPETTDANADWRRHLDQ